jgi:hypothetical protein
LASSFGASEVLWNPSLFPEECSNFKIKAPVFHVLIVTHLMNDEDYTKEE